jgi:LysR family transcriptional regulator for metE and metH
LVPANVSLAGFSHVQMVEAIIEIHKAGLGISVLARWAVQVHLSTGALMVRSFTRKGLHRQWNAAFLRHEFQPAYIRDFLMMWARRGVPFSQRNATP